jgi:L-amino acid N-acyltransferase YncA
MLARCATAADAAAIARIYNQGIEERTATFETRQRTPEDVEVWFDGVHPVVAVEDDWNVVAFAATFPYRNRECYAGIAEVSIYVDRAFRGHRAGRLALDSLIEEAGRAGFWKLVSRIFPENASSRALVRSAGFREVGVYQKHARLDDVWRDVVIVERLIDSGAG